MRARLYGALNYFQNFYLNLLAGNLRVLAYHTVHDPAKFEKQLHYLKEHFHLIDLHTLKNHLNKGEKLPNRSLLITFDDGDISVFENGLPLFKKYKIPSVLFVITKLIGTSDPYWWDQIRYCLGGEEGHKKSWEAKTWKNEERIDYLEKLTNNSEKPQLKKDQLKNSQLKQLREAGMEIANHSHTHPMFDRCTERELRYEISSSSKLLADLGFHKNVFAYPNGNYDPKAENILKKEGIEMAFLFDHKVNSKIINPLRISRIRVDSDTDIKEFKVKVSGFHSFLYHNLRKRN